VIAIFWSSMFTLGSALMAQFALAHRRPTLVNRLTRKPNRNSFWEGEWLRFKNSIAMRFDRRSRNRRALVELPELLEMMAVALSAGDSLFAAFARVSLNASGVLASEFSKVFLALELGSGFDEELAQLAKRLPQRQVIEFASKVSLGLKRGSPLSEMLKEQAKSARAEIRNDLLAQAGRNETRMLIPLVFLILPVTVLFAVYPSLQLLKINYI
jgi:tight adherence protein C